MDTHFRGAMRPVSSDHPASPRPMPDPWQVRRRIDWCELGWRVLPTACAVCLVALAVILATTPAPRS